MKNMKSYKSAEINDFIEGISFVNMLPSDHGIKLNTPSRKDVRITILPANDHMVKQRLGEICEMPRMSKPGLS